MRIELYIKWLIFYDSKNLNWINQISFKRNFILSSIKKEMRERGKLNSEIDFLIKHRYIIQLILNKNCPIRLD